MNSRTNLRLQLMREQPIQDSPTSASPLLIQQPIRFTGSRLVHLPPQIIHVQDEARTGGSLRHNAQSFPTAQNVHSQSLQQRISPQSSPYADSPRSSFTQSELDEIIIDEILSMEEEQQRRKQQTSTPPATSLEESFDETIPVRKVSSSAPASSLDIENLVKQELMREQDNGRERRKKDIHNMIERRRRYNINDRIKELGALLPRCTLEEMKLNKGSILKAAVDYIRILQQEREQMQQFQARHQSLDSENRRMVQRIQELERQLLSNGVPVPPEEMIRQEPVRKLGQDISRQIKAEPPDEEESFFTSASSGPLDTPPHGIHGLQGFQSVHIHDPPSLDTQLRLDEFLASNADPIVADVPWNSSAFSPDGTSEQMDIGGGGN